MPDETPITLTDQALARLKRLGEGNGVAPDAIQLIESKEDIQAIAGEIRLIPDMEIKPRVYAGSARGKARLLPGFAALQEEVNKQKQSFLQSKDWLGEALRDLKESPGHGWGMEEAVINLTKPKMMLAATETCPSCRGTGKHVCPQCQGQTAVICSYCHGRGQEECYQCFGRGEDPVNPGHACLICRGTRFAACRYCQTRGQLPCPTCQAKGGTPCPDCQSMGSVTQEANLNAVVKVNFHLLGGALPSGLLRSLTRLGTINIVKGHGDIELTVPEDKDAEADKTRLQVVAKVPYADIKMRILDKFTMVASFGKKGLLSGVPPFLDEALRPWRSRLEDAARGGDLEGALKARAMREALALTLSGKDKASDLRRFYPVGMSQAVLQEIMRHMGMALRRVTMRARVMAAVASVVCSAGLFAGLFFTPLLPMLAGMLSPRAVQIIEVLLPVAAVGLGWTGISHATKWVLQRQYPNAEVKLTQEIGKIGYGALASIVLVYVILFALAHGNLG